MNIWIVTPPNYPHVRCFDEAALCLSESFKELGMESEVLTKPKGRCVVFGAHLPQTFDEWVKIGGYSFCEELIVFNTEQVGSPWFTPSYIEILKKHKVWDYSPKNVISLLQMGVDAKLCEIGYHACLTRIEPLPYEYDVLHIGSLNDRRKNILNELSKHCSVVTAFNTYGEERDKLIAKSKIVLNIHFYGEKAPHEIVRTSYMMANKKFVISEMSTDLVSRYYGGGMVFRWYDELIPTCLDYLKTEGARDSIAKLGHRLFREKNQAQILKSLLG